MARNQPRHSEKPQEKAKPPVAKFGPYNTGSGLVEVSIWGNEIETDNGQATVYNVTTHRAYYDKKAEEWKQTKTFRPHDIPALVLGLQKAYDWLMEPNE